MGGVIGNLSGGIGNMARGIGNMKRGISIMGELIGKRLQFGKVEGINW